MPILLSEIPFGQTKKRAARRAEMRAARRVAIYNMFRDKIYAILLRRLMYRRCRVRIVGETLSFERPNVSTIGDLKALLPREPNSFLLMYGGTILEDATVLRDLPDDSTIFLVDRAVLITG